jgi:hypothetical protein
LHSKLRVRESAGRGTRSMRQLRKSNHNVSRCSRQCEKGGQFAGG